MTPPLRQMGWWFDSVPFDKLRAGPSTGSGQLFGDCGSAHHERIGVSVGRLRTGAAKGCGPADYER